MKLVAHYIHITKAMYSFICILLICLSATTGQKMDKGAIGFPENDENPKSANKQNRVPVFLPAKCPENELYYPGDQDSDWICDCRPGYLYHPGTDACWLAYKRGPCPAGQYLVLPKTSVIPICDNNPCIADNLVMWQGKCEVLGVIAPCGNKYPPKALWVNATSLEIECVKIYVENRFASSDNAEVIRTLCPPGCKRSLNLQCMPDPRK